MTNLFVSKINIPSADLNGESSLPPISSINNVQQKTETVLDDDDELFIGYGFLNNSFPYRAQDNYNRELKPKDLNCVILENEYLKAVFWPEYGGRLYSLYDKVMNKDLLFTNPVLRFGNLAVRNAWFSGGVEWNCGIIGHHPFTCSPLFTSILEVDGMPVLRMYEFERIRQSVFQMDFFLPDNSKLLYCRIRIVNPNKYVIPMYWWSNIAVPELQDGRVIMPADETYTNKNGIISKTTVPISNNIDITYPTNNLNAIDYFWKIEATKRKYICHLDKEGYGLVQTSTKRLKGRKLFVWGQTSGSKHWQDFLSVEGSGKYVEIQAGLANTQYECIPMPPKTAWEWLEGYGAMKADSDKVHGNWNDAQKEIESKLDLIIKDTELEKMLKSTKQSIALTKSSQLLFKGSGFGALENMRRIKLGEDLLCEHLDFGNINDDQRDLVYLLNNNKFDLKSPSDVPKCFINQPEWIDLIKKSTENDDCNWYSWLQLGMAYFSYSKFEEAEICFNKSYKLQKSCWSLIGLSNVERVKGNLNKACDLIYEAFKYRKADISLIKEVLKLFYEAKMFDNIIEIEKELGKEVKNIGRIKLYIAYAYLNKSNLDEAERLLYEDNGISVADVREGEISVTNLWFEIEKAKAERDKKVFDKSKIHPPKDFDFRT